MTVRKYRSVVEMTGVEPLPPLDPDNWRVACELSELAYGLRPWRLEPGVRRFASFKEAASDHRGQVGGKPWIHAQKRRH